MLRPIKIYFLWAGVLVLIVFADTGMAITWQEVLQNQFDIVETFDELQDWTPGGQWYSGAGCPTCPSNATLPKKQDGSNSIWGVWNNKGLSFQYTPSKGMFVKGDVITGKTSGTRATVRQVWNLDGKWYIQLTNSNAVKGTSKFLAGETISSGSKAGKNLQWPLFIANHGPRYVWRETGKSLVMDIGDNDNTDPSNPTMAGLGAQRLATFFGDGVSGKSGYKKMHVFFMMKIAPSFFLPCATPGTGCASGGYESLRTIKVFDFCSGFTNVSQWGTPSERAQVYGPNSYRLPEYGLNFSVIQMYGGGLSNLKNIFFTEIINIAKGTSPKYDYVRRASERPMRNGTTLDINSYISSGEWFGVEAAYDIGTVGNNDGSTDLWIYNNEGIEMGHFSVTRENRLMHFDHLYNKFVLGGNRLSRTGTTGGIDSRWWIDDVIINGSRIGIKYFQSLR